MRIVFASILLVAVALNSCPLARGQSQSPEAELRASLVDAICIDNGAWLWCTSHSPSRCPQLAKSVVDPCIDRFKERQRAVLVSDIQLDMRREVTFCASMSLEEGYRAIRKDVAPCHQLPIKLR